MEKQLYYYLVEFYYLVESRKLCYLDVYAYSSFGSSDLSVLEFFARKRCRLFERWLRAHSSTLNPVVYYTYNQITSLPSHVKWLNEN